VVYCRKVNNRLSKCRQLRSLLKTRYPVTFTRINLIEPRTPAAEEHIRNYFKEVFKKVENIKGQDDCTELNNVHEHLLSDSLEAQYK
jgi:hypothetical protein